MPNAKRASMREGPLTALFRKTAEDTGASARGASACSSSSSAVDRNRAESGPSRMLARLPRSMSQHLLSKTAVGECSLAVGVVLEH